jgi:mRNA-degrading endonuclease toxin of MazEF toxin-antitoxin module
MSLWFGLTVWKATTGPCRAKPWTNSLPKFGTRTVLKAGAFDVQQTAAIQAVKFVRRLGVLNAEKMRGVEQALAQVLGLKLAGASPQPQI